MRKILGILVVQIAAILILSGCGTQNNKTGTVENSGNQSITVSDVSPATTSEINIERHLGENWRFGINDISIKNKVLTEMKFSEVVETFGKPLEIKSFKIPDLSAGENEYRYFNAAVYDGMEIEFIAEQNTQDKIESTEKVFRFDLINPSISLKCGLQVGMTLDEFKEKFGNREIFDINSPDEGSELNDIKKVLKDSKPQGYYSEYSHAMIIYSDQEKMGEFSLAVAMVILLKENKVDRIILGYPTAG